MNPQLPSMVGIRIQFFDPDTMKSLAHVQSGSVPTAEGITLSIQQMTEEMLELYGLEPKENKK